MDNNDQTKTRDYTCIDDNGDLHNATLIYDVYHPKYLFRATSGLDELDEYGNLLTISQEELQRALYVTATYDEEKDRQVFHPDKAVYHLLLTHHFGEQTENMSEYREYEQQAKELGISPESLLYQNSDAYKNHFSEQWNTKDFSSSVIKEVNFNGLSLDGFKFNNCTFENCTFDHSYLVRSTFVNAKFINCEMNDTVMSQSNLCHTEIHNSIIDNVKFSKHTLITDITVSDCTINQVTGSRIRMSGLDVNDSEITGIDLQRRNTLKINSISNSKIENIKISKRDKSQFLVDPNTKIVNNNNIEINHDMTERNNGPAYHMSLGRS